MKILSIQGHFGNLNGKKIEFSEGFCHSVLPNGWGKSTLCAFVRIMLYGLDTSKRDTAAALSDKSHYLPLDGKPMMGRMTVRHRGRVITLIRSTGKGGPMQDFEAFYNDTGEKCTYLTSKGCGKELTGLGEDAFRSSAFIDGAELQRPSDELRERMLELSQTGDVEARGMQAIRTLDRWRLDLNSGNGHGLIPRLAQEEATLDDRDARVDAIHIDMQAQRAENARLEQEAADARLAYDKAYRACAAGLVSEEDRLTMLLEQSGGMVKQLEARTPDEALLRTASEALCGYEGAVSLEREKREALPKQGSRYVRALEELENERRADEIARNEAAKPHIRWWSLALALVFAVASAATILFRIDWGKLTPYMPYALSAIAMIAIIVAFAGSVRKYDAPPRDFAAERETLLRKQEQEDAEQQTAASILGDAYDSLLAAARAMDPGLETIEQAVEYVRRAQDDLQALRRERAAMQELLERQRNLRPQAERISEPGRAVAHAREEMLAAQKRLEAGQQALAQMEGRVLADSGGDEQSRRAALAQKQAAAERQYAAVCDALTVVREAQAELSARVSPKIAEYARGYMDFLTGGIYSEVQLDVELSARCAGSDGELLDSLRLSTGTRDQLFLALRLAVCEVLVDGDEPTPLILDDPLVTFDDEHTLRSMMMLRRLAQRRQIILLTCRKPGDL